MRLATPFITMLCIALIFAIIGPLNQIRNSWHEFALNNAPTLSSVIIGLTAFSVMTFAVWVLRK